MCSVQRPKSIYTLIFKLLKLLLNPIPAEGALGFTFYGDNLIWGWLHVFTFLTNTCHLLLAQCGAFICTAWMPYFTLYQTKFIIRRTSSHWISTFFSSLGSLEHKKSDCTTFRKKFRIAFSSNAFKKNLRIISFPSIII